MQILGQFTSSLTNPHIDEFVNGEFDRTSFEIRSIKRNMLSFNSFGFSSQENDIHLLAQIDESTTEIVRMDRSNFSIYTLESSGDFSSASILHIIEIIQAFGGNEIRDKDTNEFQKKFLFFNPNMNHEIFFNSFFEICNLFDIRSLMLKRELEIDYDFSKILLFIMSSSAQHFNFSEIFIRVTCKYGKVSKFFKFLKTILENNGVISSLTVNNEIVNDETFSYNLSIRGFSPSILKFLINDSFYFEIL